MNFLNTLRGPKLNLVPGEFHNEFINEIITLSCDNPFGPGYIPSVSDDVLGNLSGRYVLAAVVGAGHDNPSYFHNLLASEGIDNNFMKTDEFELWVRQRLLEWREIDIPTYERLLDLITLDATKVLNYYHIFYRRHIQTILPVGSLAHLEEGIEINELVNCPLVTVW